MGRRKKEDEMISGMEHLVKDREYILIPSDIFGTTYYTPATKKPEDQYYRISSAALSYVYKKIQERYNTIWVEYIPAPTVMDLNHAVVLCRLKIESGDINRIGDIRIGEVRVTPESNETERRSPYVSAYRKAQNKVIYMDLLKLESRYFDADGKPVVYFDDSSEMIRMEDKDAEEEEPVIAPAAEEPPLNSMEEEEYEKLSGFAVKTRNARGIEQVRKLSEMPDKLLAWFDTNDSPDMDEEVKRSVHRFVELRNKKNGIMKEAS